MSTQTAIKVPVGDMNTALATMLARLPRKAAR